MVITVILCAYLQYAIGKAFVNLRQSRLLADNRDSNAPTASCSDHQARSRIGSPPHAGTVLNLVHVHTRGRRQPRPVVAPPRLQTSKASPLRTTLSTSRLSSRALRFVAAPTQRWCDVQPSSPSQTRRGGSHVPCSSHTLARPPPTCEADSFRGAGKMVRFTDEEEDAMTDEDEVDYSDDAAGEGEGEGDGQDESDSSVFGNKVVHILNCKYCTRHLCKRAMRALLLADLKVELFSTDGAPNHGCALVNDAYLTGRCRCVISDVACLGW